MERVVRGSSRSFHRGSVSTVPRRSRGMTPIASGRREFHVLTRALILSGRFAVERSISWQRCGIPTCIGALHESARFLKVSFTVLKLRVLLHGSSGCIVFPEHHS